MFQDDNGGGGRGNWRGGGGGGRGNWNPGPREEHPATCSDCGKETVVPFKPTSGRPVYCKDCYSKRRTNRY